MSEQENNIRCPHCGNEFNVNEVLYSQIYEGIKKKYQDALIKEKSKYQDQLTSVEKERKELETAKINQERLVNEKAEKIIKEKEIDLTKTIKTKTKEEFSDAFKSLQEELNEKSSEIKELNKVRSDLERVRREKDELKETLEAESEKKLNDKLSEEREKINRSVEEKMQLKLLEKDKQITDVLKTNDDLQRKLRQGSQQMQGEVQELAIEEWLSDNFSLDTIVPIKQGARGADCLQIINTRNKQNCGTIYYESKRTKAFQPSWIEKFKNDIREKNADIGVLVTESMPDGMERLDLYEGIWVCTFEEFKGLCIVLRESIKMLSTAIITQENKGEKMGMLYDFLTGNEFKLMMEAIVEGFVQMQSDLASEKRSITGIWKKREKQIQKVLLNTTNMYNSIKGIAGNAIQTIKLLELPSGENSEDSKILDTSDSYADTDISEVTKIETEDNCSDITESCFNTSTAKTASAEVIDNDIPF